MIQFHDGQEVEVVVPASKYGNGINVLCRAKIVKRSKSSKTWIVEFSSGARAVFKSEHIRPLMKAAELEE